MQQIERNSTSSSPPTFLNVQMFARFSLRRLGPIAATVLELEDTETGRETILYEESHRGKLEMALPPAAASQAAAAGNVGSKRQTKSDSLRGTMVKRQIEDVTQSDMALHLVWCDLCQTSIANVHR